MMVASTGCTANAVALRFDHASLDKKFGAMPLPFRPPFGYDSLAMQSINQVESWLVLKKS
jgi:hypothetical protein